MSSGMWAEKYRPQTLDDMVNQRDITNRLKIFVTEKNIPHLLLIGPAGVGKTTSILALARDLYGPGHGPPYSPIALLFLPGVFYLLPSYPPRRL